MQVNRLWIGVFVFLTACLPFVASSQVNTVDYGKNRIQYKKFKWKFYQTSNFNTYFNQNGLELGKFVAQVAEDELRSIEEATEYSLQRRANLIVYNSYNDYKASNIGLGIDWQNSGGLTKLVNNKVVLYFDGNHDHLKQQVREGIARILTDNILFGDDIGEVASNAALLDLPKWLTDGYVAYTAENWSTERDDELKSAMLSGTYRNFYQFAFEQPLLAGHAFWYYVAEKYKKENVTYFLYLARLYKNLNTASQRIAKKKFKDVLADFMEYESNKYYQDIRKRRNAPKGKLSVVEEVTKNHDFYRFVGNPNAKNNSYAVVEFTKGVYQVKYVDNLYEEHTLLKFGVKTQQGDINPNYPILAWDGKGTRLLVLYWKEGKIIMFVYDAIANIKRFKQQILNFDQILDAGFMFDANTLLLSAVQNGHSDLFTFKIDNGRTKQLTNDVYDDINPSIVAFPNRSGIIFSSNRPGPNAQNSDTALPSRYPYNVFLIDLNNTNDIKQISQLTNVKHGNAMYPSQYNTNHFTFVSDENGIANRWAGFFSTQRTGLDTLLYIGDEVLRNPEPQELDSTLQAWQKDQPDSVSYFQTYKDSTYTFPITNYQSSLLETRTAGLNGQVSEVRREGDFKFLYKLRVDSLALRRRNVNARPTDYMKKILQAERLGQAATVTVEDTSAQQPGNQENQFQNEFENEPATTGNDSATASQPAASMPAAPVASKPGVLAEAGLFNYGLKFSADYVLAGVTNNVLINRYQPYAGGNLPVRLSNGNDISWTFRVGVSDVMEDIKLVGGFRFGTSIADKDVFLSLVNLRKRIDWGITYYRSNIHDYYGFYAPDNPKSIFGNNVITSLYQVNASYPFDEVRSLRVIAGLRTDKGVIRPYDIFSQAPTPDALGLKDSVAKTIITRLEYVYDNTLNPAQNIWNGLRWKIYADFQVPTGQSSIKGKHILNVGIDARNYVRIYRNFIWATRAAADFSLGEAKVLYYLGGMDGWAIPKYYSDNPPKNTYPYAFQSLAVNMRGFKQNIANGNNNIVLNSELRLPVFTTLFNKPINNAFIRNFQLTQFIDLGTAWEGSFTNIARPTRVYGPDDPNNNPLQVRLKAGGIGPLAGGYGFGARSTLLGYFLKFDVGYPMRGIFREPVYYFSLGLDF